MKRVKISFTGLLIAASAVYILSILFTNILGDCWFTMDMYADAYLAKLMAQKGTLFPESWIFGNQYYIIATPAVAGLLSIFIKDGALAIRLASCIMTAFELLLFLWCVRPFCSKRSTVVGLCCFSGAVLIGQSFSTDLRTFQLLYTMASYYSCYVIGILLCMGIFLRLNREQKVALPVVIISCAVCFALGMQSLRQTLVMIIPMALVEVWFLLSGNTNKKRTGFIIASAISNVCGLILIRTMNINAKPETGGVELVGHFGDLIGNLTDSLRSLVSIIGLDYLSQGMKWLPLGIAAVFVLIAVLAVPILIVRKKDTSPIALLCIFGWISILGVGAVGTLLMRVRNIYFFVWFLLAAFSFVYLSDYFAENKKVSALLASLLLILSASNWFYNFYPDAAKYRKMSDFSHEVVEELASEGVDTVFSDLASMPIAASASSGRITLYPVDITNSCSTLFCPVYNLTDLEGYKNIDPEKSRIVFMESPFIIPSAVEQIDMHSEEYREAFSEKVKLEKVVECGLDIYIYVYKFEDPRIFSE